MPENPPVENLDLSSIEGHAASTEWIRNNILLASPEGAAVKQLDVKLPNGGRVTLYIDTGNAYILGFRGGDNRLYLLNTPGDDAEARDFERRLRAAGYLGKDEQAHLSNLGADHKNGLRTLGQRFRPDDLIHAAQINEYGNSQSMRTPEQLRRPISLLVCMLSESARIHLMEMQFRKLYYGEIAHPGDPGAVFTYEATPDPSIQSYDKAIRITLWADELVSHPDRWYRVELLDKRAAEMRDLIDFIVGKVGDGAQRKEMLQRILSNTYPVKKEVEWEVKRLAAIAHSLKIQDAELLGAIVSACKDMDAVRAAKAGVTLWRTSGA